MDVPGAARRGARGRPLAHSRPPRRLAHSPTRPLVDRRHSRNAHPLVAVPFCSVSPKQGQDEAPTAAFVKAAGRAKVAYPNGDTFEGSFNEARQKHGKGAYVWSAAAGANAWVPEEGFPEGKAPTVRFDGQYVEGAKKGVGKITLPNGDRYHGLWEAGRFHGDGTYYYAGGDIYSGGWVKGVKQGQGTFFVARDESQLVGQWEKGAMMTGRWVWRDGTSWHGPFKGSSPLGRGVFYFPNGTMQEGEYVQEGDKENPDAELTTVWRGGLVREANTAASETTRAT